MASTLGWTVVNILKREGEEEDPGNEQPEPEQKTIYSSWSLFILIALLIIALFTSYLLQTRKIQAVHETVISIFAGMVVGLALRITAVSSVLSFVSFNYQIFFDLLLPPIILASGYELHQGNFFRHIGPILTFAFAGTFISAVVLGIVLWLWTRIGLDGMDMTFVETLSVGATLSATDPVTILAIFNTYKVDPALYTVIFGESILNDAIAIVLFQTAQKYTHGAREGTMNFFSLFESIGVFLLVFFGSLVIGLGTGVVASLMLKLTHVRRYPKTESCLIILLAYSCYFFSNAIQMSGIVSLLFCGICMKHYAYHNMSRRTQLTTKFVFQVMAQLSENFIFIYLGLSLFTETDLDYKPLFILVSTVGICVARWCAVFPLSRMINSFISYRSRLRGRDVGAEELPYPHQVILFWAGLRGAVGVALAAGLTGPNKNALRATVLVVVVLTVIIFGGTTARMLEIWNIRTGVVDEIDSDDEFDIEVVPGGTYARKAGTGYGHTPSRRATPAAANGFSLSHVEAGSRKAGGGDDDPATKRRSPSTGFNSATPSGRPSTRPPGIARRTSSRHGIADAAEQGLLSSGESGSADDDDAGGDLDLPPNARRVGGGARMATSPLRAPNIDVSSPSSSSQGAGESSASAAVAAEAAPAVPQSRMASATGAISQLFSGLSEDPATAFRQIDEGFIKPHLLLDPGRGNGHHHGGGAGGPA